MQAHKPRQVDSEHTRRWGDPGFLFLFIPSLLDRINGRIRLLEQSICQVQSGALVFWAEKAS